MVVPTKSGDLLLEPLFRGRLRKENVTLQKVIGDPTRLIGEKDRQIADMQAELERLRRSAG